jgi:hypothetical protein
MRMAHRRRVRSDPFLAAKENAVTAANALASVRPLA